MAWRLSTEAFGLAPDDIWVTVFAGDDAARTRPRRGVDRGSWLEIGVPREKIVECDTRGELVADGADRPVRPRAPSSTSTAAWTTAAADDLPGGEHERWPRLLEPRVHAVRPEPRGCPHPAGGERASTPAWASTAWPCILQGTETPVFETDQFAPLIALGEELSGRRYGTDFRDRQGAARARRPQPRGLVPARRRRRALQRGPRLRAAAGHAPRDPAWPRRSTSGRATLQRYAERRRPRLMAADYPELHAGRDPIRRWLASEEETFGRTLELGLEAPRRADRPGTGSWRRGDRRRRRVPVARHVRVPDRHDARDRGRARPRRRRGRASRR